MIGETLASYRVLNKLGAGGMGEVYRAKDTRLDRTVAIKILSPGSGNPRQSQRFAREARAVSKVNHPHICTLYDIGEQNGVHFIVMDTSRAKRWPSGFGAVRCRSIKSSATQSRLPTRWRTRTDRASSIVI